MGVGAQEDPLGGRRAGVGAEADPGQRHLAAHVLLRHREVDDADPAVVLDHQVHRRLLPGLAALGGDLGQGPADQRLELVVAEAHQEHLAGRQQIHLLGHAAADLRVAQALDPGVVAALLDPERHGGVEAGGAGGVGVDVGGDRQPLGARRLDARDHRLELRPVLRPRRLEMVDLGPHAGPPGDLQQLLERLQQLSAFASHVRDVHAAECRGHLGQGDQLVGVGEVGRRVDQRRADAQRPLLHRPAHELAHPLQLLGRRRPVLVADLVDPHRRRAHERGHVRRHAALLQVLEVLAERRPGDVVADVVLALDHLLLHRLVERPHRPALAEDLQRHALEQVAHAAAVLDQAGGGPAQHVDEARRHRQAAGVDVDAGACRRQIADLDDAVTRERQIGNRGRTAEPVVDGAAADQYVVVHRAGAAGQKHRGAEQSAETLAAADHQVVPQA